MLCTDQTLTSQAFWICSSHWKTLVGLGAQWHEHWMKNRCKYATQISLTHGWPLKRSNTTSFCVAFHFNKFTFHFLILFSHVKKNIFILTCYSQTRLRSSEWWCDGFAQSHCPRGGLSLSLARPSHSGSLPPLPVVHTNIQLGSPTQNHSHDFVICTINC